MSIDASQRAPFWESHELCGDGLVQPLFNFHGRLVRTCDNLPEESIALEIIIRVLVVISIPFSYLILSILALVGLPIKAIAYCAASKPNLSNFPIEPNPEEWIRFQTNLVQRLLEHGYSADDIMRMQGTESFRNPEHPAHRTLAEAGYRF